MKTLKITLSLFVTLGIIVLLSSCKKVVEENKEVLIKGHEDIQKIEHKTKADLSNAEQFFHKKISSRKVTKSELPTAIAGSYKKEFPMIEVVEWDTYPEVITEVNNDSIEVYEIEEPEIYIATFDLDSSKIKAKYNKEGKLLETKKSLTKENLPQKIAASLNTGIYKDWQIISESQEVKSVVMKEPVYKVAIKKGDEKYILYFDKNGNIEKKLKEV